MEELTRERAIVLKDRIWAEDLKPYYEPKDVLRFCKHLSRFQTQADSFNVRLTITPWDRFFTKEVWEVGMVLMKRQKLTDLQNRLEYLMEVEIPDLKSEINKLKIEP